MRNKLIILPLLLTAFCLTAPQYADAKLGERNEAIKEKIQERKEDREEDKDKRCTKLEESISKRVANFDNIHKAHQRQYELMKEKIAKVILEKAAEGKDVTKLRADLATLNEKIEKFNTDRVAFIDALKKTQVYACGDSQGAFKDALTDAQAKQKLVLADSKDIRNYYQTTIRADLKALRD